MYGIDVIEAVAVVFNLCFMLQLALLVAFAGHIELVKGSTEA